MKTIRVRLSGGYDAKGIDRLVHLLKPILDLDRPARIVLDLTDLIFLGPSALALLTAVMKRVEDTGVLEYGEILLPSSDALSRHLSRMDFVKILTDGNGLSGEKPPKGSRPCQHFQTNEEGHLVARELVGAIAEKCDTDDQARFSINVCLNELSENVVYHSESVVGGFAAAGAWSGAHVVELAMVDLGRGIRESLTKNPRYADIADDVTAVRTALESRVTATPDRNSGIGLFVTKLLLEDNGGLFLVRSGRAAVYAGSREVEIATDVEFPGTLVVLRARTDRALNIRHAYRRLGDGPTDLGDPDAAPR